MLLAAGLLGLGWLWFGPKPTGKLQSDRGGTPLRVAKVTSKISQRSAQLLPPLPTGNAPLVVVNTRPAQTNASKPPAPSRPAPSPRSESVTNTVLIEPENYPRPTRNAFEMQVALARLAFSPGSVDGQTGAQTRSALRAFQRRAQLLVSGEFDSATREKLLLTQAPTRAYEVTSDDLARLQPLSATWLGKSQQTALDYETLLECLSEKARASPNIVRRLNPPIDWSAIEVGQTIEIPDVVYPQVTSRAAFISISLVDKTLEAWDQQTNLLAHFPCSIARQVEKRPAGELHVAVIAPNPNYTFDPEIFPESAEAKSLTKKLVLPPGPNNPVGIAWIGLDKPGYGIHGTPSPEQVGRTESHGCFRLANWNAEYLLRLVEVGTPVYVQP